MISAALRVANTTSTTCGSTNDVKSAGMELDGASANVGAASIAMLRPPLRTAASKAASTCGVMNPRTPP